uniref:PX domain-containing protein n=2 Tax=Phytophthora fragariae TaxID=53985 RepID=A0A6A3D6B5_9STRA|nr:hypothetical protein PF009_g33132 [Phytophthora fragariae]
MRGREKVMYHIDVVDHDAPVQTYIIRRSYSDFKDLHSQLTRSVQPPDDDAVDWPSSYRLICRCCVAAFSSFSSSSSSSAQLKMALDGGYRALSRSSSSMGCGLSSVSHTGPSAA